MKKLFQTIKLRKLKTEMNEESINKMCEGEYLVLFQDNTCRQVMSKDNLMRILEKDHIKPIRYIFSMADRIVIDRDIAINTDKI